MYVTGQHLDIVTKIANGIQLRCAGLRRVRNAVRVRGAAAAHMSRMRFGAEVFEPSQVPSAPASPAVGHTKAHGRSVTIDRSSGMASARAESPLVGSVGSGSVVFSTRSKISVDAHVPVTSNESIR